MHERVQETMAVVVLSSKDTARPLTMSDGWKMSAYCVQREALFWWLPIKQSCSRVSWGAEAGDAIGEKGE